MKKLISTILLTSCLYSCNQYIEKDIEKSSLDKSSLEQTIDSEEIETEEPSLDAAGVLLLLGYFALQDYVNNLCEEKEEEKTWYGAPKKKSFFEEFFENLDYED